ncbi:MAG TPA: ComEC/Rec2 family competence protein [bacterium]|mgnify:FL=1|nr:ComEC/Rec2 family competence protein [bacterium]HPL95847.1 ComEC/Rec2 family competence protein [bacterium]
MKIIRNAFLNLFHLSTKAAVFQYFSWCFLSGLALFSFFTFPLFYFFILIVSLPVIFLFLKETNYRRLILGAVFVFLGCWRFFLADLNLQAPNNIQNFIHQETNLTGRVSHEPSRGEHSISLALDHLILNKKDNPVKLTGKLLVYFPLYQYNLSYGATIKLSCLISPPTPPGGEVDKKIISYEKYLRGQGIDALCYLPVGVKIIPPANQNLWQKFQQRLINFKSQGQKIIQQNISSPAAELLAGMILNFRREIPPVINQAFAQSGLSHIIAISGLNIALMAGFLWYLCYFFGLSRRRAFYLGLAILTIYILMIGSPAPAVRALIMAGVFMYGQKIGRPTHSFNALLLTADLMLLINPKLLIFDLSFQLSFLALTGMIFLYPYLEKKTTQFKNYWGLKSLIILTLSAQIFTWPLIAYNFNTVSLIAPLTNILVIPLIPIITALSMIMILIGLIYQPLIWPLALILNILINYVIKIANLGALVPSIL